MIQIQSLKKYYGRGENRQAVLKGIDLSLPQGSITCILGPSGIGKHCALLFAKEGAKVVINGRNKERGTAVLEEIKAHGGEAIFVPGDVMKEEDLQHLVDETIQTYGKLDVLVNNAGIFKLLSQRECSTLAQK